MLDKYIQIQSDLKKEKENIVKYITQGFYSFKNDGVKTFIAKRSDLTNTWSPEDVYNSVKSKENGKEPTKQRYYEIERVSSLISKSDNLVYTLSEMLRTKNCSKKIGMSFEGISESTLIRIAEVLGVEYPHKKS